MSAVAPLRAPRPAPAAPPRPRAQQPSRPRLSIVAGSTHAGRAPFTVLVASVLVGGLVLLLMLHTFAAQDGFQVRDLQQRLSKLSDQEQALQVADQQLQAPESLRARAQALGMVPASVSSYHRLTDGRAVGLEQPVSSPSMVAAVTAASTASGGGATHKHADKSTTTTKPKAATTKKTKAATTTKTTTATTTKTATTRRTTTTRTTAGRHHHPAGTSTR